MKTIPRVVLLISAALCLGIVPQYIAGSFTYNRWDNYEFYTAAIYYAHCLLLSGKFPVINFHQHLGDSILGMSQAGVFYPFYALAVALLRVFHLKPDDLTTVIVVLHLFIGIIGFYGLFRALRVRSSLAVLGAMTAISGGYVISYAMVWVFMLPVFCWIAWIVWAKVWLLEDRNRIRAGILLSFALALVAWIGHPQMLCYVWVFTLLIALLASTYCYGSITRMGRLLPWYGVAVLLSAPSILPAYFFKDETIRTRVFSLSEFQDHSATFVSFLGIFQPLLRVENGFLTDQASPFLYQGSHTAYWLLSLIAGGIFSVLFKKRKQPPGTGIAPQTIDLSQRWTVVIFGVSILFAVFALGRFTPIYQWTRIIPIWNSFRWPNKFLLLVNWGFIVSAILYGETMLKTWRSQSRLPKIVMSVLLAILIVIGLQVAPSPFLASASSKLVLITSFATIALMPWFDRSWIRMAVVICSLASGIATISLCHDLRPKTYSEPFGEYSAHRLGIDPSYRVVPLSHDPTGTEHMQQYSLFHSATMNGYDSLTGATDLFVPLRYLTRVRCDFAGVILNDENFLPFVTSNFLKSLNVGYFVVGKDSGSERTLLSSEHGFEKAADLDQVRIYKNPGALSRIYFATEVRPYNEHELQVEFFENRAPPTSVFAEGILDRQRYSDIPTIRSTEWDPSGRITVEIHSSAPSFAVFSVLALSNWKAWIDGHIAEVHRVNDLIVGVSVPANAHRVVLKFEPKGVREGLLLGLGGLVFLGYLVTTGIRRNFAKKRKLEFLQDVGDA